MIYYYSERDNSQNIKRTVNYTQICHVFKTWGFDKRKHKKDNKPGFFEKFHSFTLTVIDLIKQIGCTADIISGTLYIVCSVSVLIADTAR